MAVIPSDGVLQPTCNYYPIELALRILMLSVVTHHLPTSVADSIYAVIYSYACDWAFTRVSVPSTGNAKASITIYAATKKPNINCMKSTGIAQILCGWPSHHCILDHLAQQQSHNFQRTTRTGMHYHLQKSQCRYLNVFEVVRILFPWP